MSARLFIVLILVFAFLQGPLLPSVFAEGLLIVLLVFSRGLKRSLPFIFVVGILFDLFQNRAFGASSLVFVGLAGASWYLRSYITPQKGLFLTACVLAINFARSYFVYNNNDTIVSTMFVAVISLVVFNILQPVISSRRGYEV